MPQFRLVEGLIGGGVAGLAQAVVLALGAVLLGKAASWFFTLIGYVFRPYADTPDTHAQAVLRGFATHMVITVVLGGLFGVLAPLLPPALPLWLWGVIYGVIIWAVGRYVLLSIIDPTLHRQFNTVFFLVTHFVYGGVLGWWLQRS